MKGLGSSNFVMSFQSSLVDFAERFAELTQIWYELLFEYQQNGEKLARIMMLFSDEAVEIAKGFLDKDQEEINSGDSKK